MNHAQVKALLISAVNTVSSSIVDYAVNPGKDFTRNRKLPADKLIRFLIAEGSSTTKNEIIDFFGTGICPPSSSAFVQQREKLKPEALYYKVLELFNASVSSYEKQGMPFCSLEGQCLL